MTGNTTQAMIDVVDLLRGLPKADPARTRLANMAANILGFAIGCAAAALLFVYLHMWCFAVPPLAERFGRRWTQAFLYTLMLFSISLGFGYAFYLQQHALAWFLVLLFVMGFGGANHTMYSLWLPEQYRTECRASAFGFTTSIGRFVGAVFTFLVGAGVSRYGTIGTPVAMTSLAFLVGLALLPWGVETKGQPLPD